MQFKRTSLAAACLVKVMCSFAQQYHAINGSIYAGSLAPGSNPASILFVPYSWDVTPIAFQFKQCTNAFAVKDFSLLSPSGNTTVENSTGIKKRFFYTSQDLRLMNTRMQLNDRSAIAVGFNIRSYNYGSSSKSNYQDTTFSLADFQRINLQFLPMSFEGAGAVWSELYGTYARTIIDDGYKIMNAAFTLKYNRSVAGAYVAGNNINYIPDTNTTNARGFLLTAGTLQYGYSANLDLVKSSNSVAENRKSVFQNNNTSLGFDVGIEYIIPGFEENVEEDFYDYKTKIGIAVMDIGSHRFSHSSKSRAGNTVKLGVNDTILENKFKSVRSMDDFNDSLATISSNFTPLQGDFVVYSPARLEINLDQRIRENIYLNAALTLPLIRLAKNSLFIKDINLLSITARWETRNFGAYLPLLVNMRKQVFVGGAFRAGPLLLGVHNLANIFGKNSIQNGGMYLALTIRPGKKQDGNRNSSDPEKIRQLKKLKCVSF